MEVMEVWDAAGVPRAMLEHLGAPQPAQLGRLLSAVISRPGIFQ